MTSTKDRPGEANAEATVKPLEEAESQITAMGYGSAAERYRQLGWLGVLPVPRGQKKPVPTGYTGADGKWPDEREVFRWSWMYPTRNIALRLPEDVLGIDIDAYKPAAISTVCDALDRCGQLPRTWRSTSRDDGVSGIYLYRVPVGINWVSELGAGVEIIRFGYRYMLVWPSIHPEHGHYAWHECAGLPRPQDLPELPHKWIAELTDTGRRPRNTSVSSGPAEDAKPEVTEAMTSGRPMFEVARRLTRALADIDGPDRHTATCRHVLALLALGHRGQPGVGSAVEHLRRKFISVVGPAREGGREEASEEFDRMVRGAWPLLERSLAK